MKLLDDICVSRKFILNNTSELHLYLLACFQNEPQYAIEYLSQSSIENQSETFYKNLKVKIFDNI